MKQVVPVQRLKSGNTLSVARWLLGKMIMRCRSDGTVSQHMITEVEAYDGENDRASHASRGRTARTEVMYREGGIWYVYLCYGVHEMLNLVTGPADYPAAILIRGIAGINGPGRLTKALEIDRRLNGTAAAPQSGLWIEDHGLYIAPRFILAAPRIGVGYAGPIWAGKPWRLQLDAKALRG